MESFISAPSKFTGLWQSKSQELREQRFVRNPNWIAFGFENRPYNQPQLERAINDIQSNFDLIMITEYFLESLILLRYELCLTMQEAIV